MRLLLVQVEELAKDLPDKVTFADVGWDRIKDTANCFAKGVGGGFNEFTTNIQSLWEPSRVMTASECETASIISLLGDSSSPYHDDLLYGSFNVGKYVGKEGITDVLKAIPATKVVGEVIDTIENVGESRKEYFRGSDDSGAESYFGSLAHSCLDNLTEKGIEMLMDSEAMKKTIGNLHLSPEREKIVTEVAKTMVTGEVQYIEDQAIHFAKGEEVDSFGKSLQNQLNLLLP